MRRLLWVLAFLLPFTAVAVASAALADRAGRSLGAALARALSALSSPPAHPSPPFLPFPPAPSPPAEAELPPPAEALLARIDTPAERPRAAPARANGRPQESEGPHGAHGIRVRAPVVLRIAQSGVRPSASPVAASGKRPAGLSLSGVSKLGVGLQDGDILTQVAGTQARSLDAVIGAVVAAYSAAAPAVSGRFWRSGEEWQIVVELPYPK